MKLKYPSVLFLILITLLLIFWGKSNWITNKKVIITTPAPPPEISAYKPRGQVIFHGKRDKKVVALTFDADMTPKMKKDLQSGKVKSWYNKKIIDILERTNTKATLFLTGMWIELYPNEVKELASNPLFELANHSYSHPVFEKPCHFQSLIPDSKDEEEVLKTRELLKTVANVENHLFRFPGGCYSKNDVEIISKLGFDIIQWDSSGQDAFSNNKQTIIDNVLKTAQNGSIIVLHMHGNRNAPQTANALPEIISALKNRGYTFAKVSELITE